MKVVKEIIIMLLICLAIILVGLVLLYNYNPMTKILPEEVSYTTPENVKQEINKSGDVDTSQVILTYEVDQADLNNYQRIKTYEPGKSNPFSAYEEVQETTENNNSNTGTSTSTGGGSSNSGTTVIEENTSPYTQNKGTK